jgi:hypothetical protein
VANVSAEDGRITTTSLDAVNHWFSLTEVRKPRVDGNLIVLIGKAMIVLLTVRSSAGIVISGAYTSSGHLFQNAHFACIVKLLA